MFNYKLKNLRFYISSSSGRNSSGKITVRHKWRGSKKIFLSREHNYLFWNIPGLVVSFDFDFKFRKWFILVSHHNGLVFYKLASVGIGVGSIVQSGVFASFLQGNSFFLRDFYLNSFLHSLYQPSSRNIIISSSGCSGVLLFSKKSYFFVRLPSKKIIKVSSLSMATYGKVFNTFKKLESYLKAGSKYKMGWKPSVRGVAMNPVDHPHGGGEGKTKGRFSVSIWGWLTK